MSADELNSLADAWIVFTLSPKDSAEYESHLHAFSHVSDLTCEEPQAAWQVILAILGRNHSHCIFENLSADPLEDLLTKHGATMIDFVEAEARRNLMFAKLLGGVWKNDMSDATWARVQAVWNRSGWDDNL